MAREYKRYEETPEDRELLAGVGARIRAAREAKGLAIDAAARLADMDKSNWWRVEQGEVNPSLITLARMCRALDIQFDIELASSGS